MIGSKERVPAVYLASANSPDFAILSVRKINDLHAVNVVFSSIPTTPSHRFPHNVGAHLTSSESRHGRMGIDCLVRH
jgi:hypothetical protein